MPNGREVADPHYAYKLDWLARLRDAAEGWLRTDAGAQVGLMGDWNIAPQEDDVWDMAASEGATHVSPPERAAFDAFGPAGFTDVVRPYAPGPEVYTYGDYQRLRFPQRHHLLLVDALSLVSRMDVPAIHSAAAPVPITANIAPFGSLITAVRPYGVSCTPPCTTPPRSVAAAIAASASATAK